jgi:hypothetical protein
LYIVGQTKQITHSLLVLVDLKATTDKSGSAGSNETDLLTDGGITTDSRGVTNMLLVTTTVRMVDGVHSNTTNAGVVVLLCLSLEPSGTGLKEGLIGSLSSSDNADHSTAATLDGLTDAGGEADTGLGTVFGVTDDNGGSAGGAGEGSTVTELGLDVGDNGAFGHVSHGEDIADGEGSY